MTTNLNLNFVPPLDPDFQPAVLFNRDYIQAANVSGQAVAAASLPMIER